MKKKANPPVAPAELAEAPPPSELELLRQSYTQLAMKLGDLTYQCDAIRQEMRALNFRADQIKKDQIKKDLPSGPAAAP